MSISVVKWSEYIGEQGLLQLLECIYKVVQI